LAKYKTKLEQYLTEDDLNEIKNKLTTEKDKLKLTEIIELDDLKNNVTEKYLTTKHIENQMYRYKVIIDQYKSSINSNEHLCKKEY